MGHRCCSKQKVKRGLWSPEEDEKLVRHITTHGHGCWSSVPKLAGLQRCGKSCRLRWINYLRPDLKRGTFTAEEEQIIVDVHRILGNRWAQIAKHLPGRTDNEVKNFWNSCIKKKLISQGLDPKTHNLMVTNHKKYHNKTSPTHHKPTSSSLFTVNSRMTPEISIETNQPFVAVPPLPSVIHNTQSPLQPTSEFQNPNTIWAVKDQDFVSFPCDQTPNIKSTPISSSSSCSVNPSAFGFLEDINFMWGTSNGGVEVAFEERQQKEHEPQKEKITCEVVEVEKINEQQQKEDMDAPFDSFNFDLEFVESTLMAGTMSRELTSMDDLAWNF